MKLFEHPEFEQLILAAESHFNLKGLTAAAIEKDYFVTEALRLIALNHGEHVIFKGGTSLSKGWDIIQRFSEDVDLFLDPDSYSPTIGAKKVDRELKAVRDTISKHPGLAWNQTDSRTFGGSARSDYFLYEPRFPGRLRPSVFLEAGIASGRQPTEVVKLESYVARFLRETSRSLGSEDETSFEMRLLHFRRTFVEKLFAIHGKILAYLREGRPLGTYARHYYDLYMLAQKPEVIYMLESSEYEELRIDYDGVSRRFFSKFYEPPEGLRFYNSPALFPDPELNKVIKEQYQEQCSLLCFGDYPSWERVAECFAALRKLL